MPARPGDVGCNNKPKLLNPKPDDANADDIIWGLIKIMGPFGVCIIVYSL